MADSMVVARVPQEKKASVARKLAALGTNPSSVINKLYDYIDMTGELPFPQEEGEPQERVARIKAARDWLGSLGRLREGNAFQSMSDDQIRAARLNARGFDVEAMS